MIARLYERLIALLGTTETDPLFIEFLNDIKHERTVEDEIAFRLHEFPALGIVILFNAMHDCFTDIWFSIQTPSIEVGAVVAYSGKFTHDIRTSDLRFEVRRKLTIAPVCSSVSQGSQYSPDCIVNTYELGEFEVKFNFDIRTDQMRAASVRLRDIQNRQEAMTRFLSKHPEFASGA